MTRSSNQSNPSVTPRATRVAAVQTLPGGELAIVFAEIGGSSFVVTDALLSGPDEAGEALRSRKVELTIRLVPATETVCRVLTSPELTTADRASVADALSLQAESELPSSIAWHRRSAGMIRLGGRQATLLTGWVRGEKDGAAGAALSGIPEVWVAEIAALGALGQASGAIGMVGLADQATGALSLLAFGTKRPVGRVLRLGASDAGWDSAVRGSWTETAAAAGIDAACPATDGLMMEVGTTVRLGGGNRDREWIWRHGLAIGAIALYADPDAAVSALVGMTPEEPRRAMPIAQRAVDWLSRPRNAAVVGAACIGALLFAPWVAAEMRYKMLRNEAGSLTELDRRLSEADRQAEFYKLLSQKRWPMTKLLADIAGAAPVGVTLESVELTQGEAISIRAVAESSDLVTAFRKNLSDTTVFRDVATPSIDATSEGVTFQLQARLSPSGAITASRPIVDFASKTLAQHLYGDDATMSPGWRTDDAEEDDGDRASDDRGSRTSGRGRDEPSRTASRADRPTAIAPVMIPPPLSDADIAAMNKTAAMKEWGVRKKASTQPGIDPADKERLAAEAEKCRERMVAAGSGT